MVSLMSALALLLLLPGFASAHERRTVGKYQMVVGWINEPAYLNDRNSLDLTICNGDCKTENGVVTNPIKNAQETLKAEVSSNGIAPIALTLSPRFGADGKYNGWVYPTKTGDYTFHIYGTINGDNVDEKFSSGPKTFGTIEEPLQYPVKAGAETVALQQQVKEARDTAGTATIFAILGTVFGIVGMTLAIFGLARGRQMMTATSDEIEKTGNGRGPQAG